MPHHALGDGRRIYAEVTGAGPALVLLNGMSQSTASWLSHVRALSARHTVVCYDARGQGRSDLGDIDADPLSLDGHVADLSELLDALALDAIALCGFSHGARVALAFAAARPTRVTRLLLTSTGDSDDPLRRTIVRSWAEVLARGGLEAMAWCSLADILGRDFLGANERHLETMVRATLQRNTVAGLTAMLAAMATFRDPSEDAHRVRCPALVIASPNDLLVSPQSAMRLTGAIPGAALTWIDGCGHTIPIEQPERWRSGVLAFLTGGTA